MANFNQTMRPTPFGYWDSDPIFQTDADKLVVFVLRRLGEDTLTVELTKKQIYAAFEEAALAFNAAMIEYRNMSDLSSLLGTNTGSLDSFTSYSENNVTNLYTYPNLEFLIKMAEPYAAEVGYGQSQESYSGSIVLKNGQQDYDIYDQLVDEGGTPLTAYQPTGFVGRMKVLEVYHEAPVQFAFNSNLASNFVASGMPVESYIPDTRFYVLPLFEDVLRAGMLETAHKIRRSHYSYRITGRKIRIFPAPRALVPSFSNRLWLRVSFPSSTAPGVIGTPLSGSGVGIGVEGSNPVQLDQLFGANSPANVPFGLIDYKSLNPWARNWIFQYTLAICMEMLGRVRSKMKNIPYLDGTLELDGSDLVSQGREQQDKLLNTGDTGLLAKLKDLTYDKLQEREAKRAEDMMKHLQHLPFPPAYLFKRW